MELEPMSNPNMYFMCFINLISLIRYKFKKNFRINLCCLEKMLYLCPIFESNSQ